MKKIIYMLLILVLINCSTKKESNSLYSDALIQKTFTKNEIKDLQKILDFFNSEMCKSVQENINDCYLTYCSRIEAEVKKHGMYKAHIDFKKQYEVYKQINSNTFREIWLFQQSLPLRERKDTLKYLGFNHSGKYIRFLNEYGKENKAVKHYIANFNTALDFGPSMINQVIMNYETFQIENIKSKLLIAIHYLTLNDQNLRKEEY
ncbi:hypothetical protein [Tenacibaculum jejuense]|uniref:Uncharacterized protein n=1 Tax=Tenacibaculum jejuense TaxID=584609 RepID=A0A238U9D9_9FLAO|nr:hypothetical protein [Tenacibaculum jejuense]SNR15178.1 conserved protein of unknown function [Tenacibaculum jejuense]